MAPRERTLFAGDVPLHLPAKEFETLLFFVENNGRALSKQEMMERIWHDSFVEEVNLAKQISRIRKMLKADGGARIETLPKHGYRFSADLQLAPAEPEHPVVIEKHTVKRLTVSVESQPERRVKSPKKFILLAPIRLAFLIGALTGTVYFAWLVFSKSEGTIDPYAPVRLTDNPNHDTGPIWTKDGRIRFHRVYPDYRSETWIMNVDGTGQSEIKFADGRTVLNWSPDESRMQYMKAGDKTNVYLSNADGSGEVLLPNRGGRWSADSRFITTHQKVIGHNYDIFVYSIETGENRNITNSPDFDADPSFSPDGSKIVFASGRDGNAEIYAVNVDGSDLRRLTFNPTTDSHAAYSQDGTQILFNSDRENENGDVYLMNADGSNPRKLTTWDKSNETAGPGSWSPDGTKISFFSDRNGKDDIYVVSAETVRPTVVLSDANRHLYGPSFSPDGSTVAYSSAADDRTGELRTLDLTSGRTRLLRKTELPATDPVWSPDGKRIAFTDRIGGNSEACAINADGSGFANLSNDPAIDNSPSWSPDGTRLAFVSYRGEPRVSQLYTMRSDGNDPRPLTPQKGWEGDPVFSPDGGELIFVCDRADSPGNVLDICRINADGTGEQRILFNRDHDSSPAISPDGKRIAFVATSDGNPEIYVMNRSGTNLLRLTRNTADDLSPNWSPDSRTLVFTSNRNGRSAIYEIELSI